MEASNTGVANTEEKRQLSQRVCQSQVSPSITTLQAEPWRSLRILLNQALQEPLTTFGTGACPVRSRFPQGSVFSTELGPSSWFCPLLWSCRYGWGFLVMLTCTRRLAFFQGALCHTKSKASESKTETRQYSSLTHAPNPLIGKQSQEKSLRLRRLLLYFLEKKRKKKWGEKEEAPVKV